MERPVLEMSNAELLKTVCGSKSQHLASRPLSELFGIVAPRYPDAFASDVCAPYTVPPLLAAAKELYTRALQEHLQRAPLFSSPSAVRSFLCGRLAGLEYEAFWCLWVNTQQELIVAEEMFRGTLSSTSVYPREVLKRALFHNAAALLAVHNHPSGIAEPSRSDELLTNALRSTLALVDVKVLDHIIVAGNRTCSFAERGLL
jgi:DNA repair protein RadC